MSLVVQTMPDDPTRLARWLDEILVGDRLGDLVDELAVVHPGRAGASLHQVLGEEVDVVLDRGLVSLSTDAFRALMRQPHLFLELQELVFLNGATYWSQISRPGSLGLRTAEMWTAIAKRLPSSEPVIPLREVKPRSREWYRDVAVSLATAAAIFLTITLVGRFGRANTPPVASVGWGWSKNDGLPKNSDARGYLNSLADIAEEWQNQRPETRSSVAMRVLEFRQGCTAVLLADHPPLTIDQRNELKARCRKWASKLDDVLARLENGEDVERCRFDVDLTVQSLVKYLRTEAGNS